MTTKSRPERRIATTSSPYQGLPTALIRIAQSRPFERPAGSFSAAARARVLVLRLHRIFAVEDDHVGCKPPCLSIARGLDAGRNSSERQRRRSEGVMPDIA
jgi:hypothetical protein